MYLSGEETLSLNNIINPHKLHDLRAYSTPSCKTAIVFLYKASVDVKHLNWNETKTNSRLKTETQNVCGHLAR